MENKLHKCFCGKRPQLNQQIHCDGQTEYWSESYVECSCGLRGKSFDTNHTEIGQADVKAAEWWNKFIDKYKFKL